MEGWDLSLWVVKLWMELDRALLKLTLGFRVRPERGNPQERREGLALGLVK